MVEEEVITARVEDNIISVKQTTDDIPKQENPADKHKLSFSVILLITVNSIMGTGIFFLPAVGAREAGLFAIISWFIMGVIAIYYSMIFGELVSRYPKEGGVYEYAKEAFGFFPSFLLGWLTLISANVTIAMLMVGAIKYVGPSLANPAIAGISILFILAFNLVAFKGLKTGKVMLVTFAGITLASVFGIIIPAFIKFNPSNFTDWFTHEAVAVLPTGSAGYVGIAALVLGTIFFIAETFFGWETTTFLAEKVKNPRVVMPKALVRGTVIIAIISLLFVIASKSVLHWSVLAESATPLAALASAIYGAQIVPMYSILVYLAIIGSVAGWIIAAPNLLVALAKDKLFVPSYADLHSKTGTPYKAIIFQTIVTSLLVIVGAGNYETLLHLLVPMVLILYACVILSLVFIRRKHPDFDGYKAPGGRFGPWLLILVTFALIVIWTIRTESAQHTLEIIGSFVLVGIPIFLLMNFHHNPHASLAFQNKTAGFAKFTEKFFLPKKIRKRIVQGLTMDHTILFLSAGSGIIIKEPNVNEKKTIVLEHSLPLVKYLQKRFKQVRVIHDEHLISRIHPDVTEMDCVVSLGLLSHIQDLASYLNHVRTIVPQGGSIRFFDYADFYKFIPNKILPDDDLRRIFRLHGFAVSVERIKGIFWTYLIIQGVRTDNEDMVFA